MSSAVAVLSSKLLIFCQAVRILASSSLAVGGFVYPSDPRANRPARPWDCGHARDAPLPGRCRPGWRQALGRGHHRRLLRHTGENGSRRRVSLRSTAQDGDSGGESEHVWDVYVSQPIGKQEEKGGIPTSSLVQAFMSLAPSPDAVRVHLAVFHKHKKHKGKGRPVRCIRRKRSVDDGDVGEIVSALEIGNVDSLDKVYRIMTEHMELGEIDPRACECMRCFFEGNQYLERGEPSQAIALYDRALSEATGHPSLSRLPEGSILMKRARAHLRRAAKHRSILRMHVEDLADAVPSASAMRILFRTAAADPALSSFIFDRLAADARAGQAKFRQVRYRHDMYEFALLHAARDGLQSTRILPRDASAWVLAGECLAELRKLEESNRYYHRAVEVDPGMERALREAMERNGASQEFIDAARASGFSGDTLRLALDVAA